MGIFTSLRLDSAAPTSFDPTLPADARQFKMISSNDYSCKFNPSLFIAYIADKNTTAASHTFVDTVLPCECTAKNGACGLDSSCINRILFMECNDDCPAGRFCQNKLFTQKAYASGLQVFETPGKGCGLKTTLAVSSGSFIMEYVGEIVSPDTMAQRIERAGYNTHYYFMTLNSEQIIDASEKGNVSRFMNHSCSPNCETQKWIVNNQMRIGIFAIKNISPGTELTFDYKFEHFGNKQEIQACLCGEASCKGVIGASSRARKRSSKASIETIFSDSSDDEQTDQGKEKSPFSFHEPKGIEDPGLIPSLLKKLITIKKIAPLRRQLQILNATTSLLCLKKFVQLHGLLIFKTLLIFYKKEPSIVYYILSILSRSPIASKNKVEDSGIDLIIGSLFSPPYPDSDSDEYPTYQLSQSVLEKWSTLPRVFKIPKRVQYSKDTDCTPALHINRDEIFLTHHEINDNCLEEIRNKACKEGSSLDTNCVNAWDECNHVPPGLSAGEGWDTSVQSSWEKHGPEHQVNSWGTNSTETWGSGFQAPVTCEQATENSYKLPDFRANEASCDKKVSSTDLFSHLMNSTSNSLKQHIVSIASVDLDVPNLRKEKRAQIPSPNQDVFDAQGALKGFQTSLQATSTISSAQIQQIIRSVTSHTSLSPNAHDNDLNDSIYDVGSLGVDGYRDQWTRLLKIPTINLVSSVINRYQKQMDVEMFKRLNRKISHSLLEKEVKNRENTAPTRAFRYDEKRAEKMKQYVREYLYKLGYKKPDPRPSSLS